MKRILIVDDLKEVRELVEVTLNVGDFHIIKASSGEEAVEIAKNINIDLVIMDIMMPNGMDGLSATRIIKNDTNNNNVKVIMLTARGQEHDKQKGFEAGADAYFIKPFSPLDLINKVDEILGNS